MVKKLFGKAKDAVTDVKATVKDIDTSKVTTVIADVVKDVDTEKVAKVVKDTAVGAVEESVEVVKGGVFGILHGVLFKIIATVIFIVIILSAGCVGTSVTIDKLTSDTPTEQTQIKEK